jgi:glycerol-3-phosphate dehydrogenase
MSLGAEIFDIVVIGGGVNGCGIARDAVGRGLKVLLAEQSDLASGTSSASTKLIHGGLRYLEHKEFRLVREALIEREVLLRAAPHIIWPLRFVLPHHKGLRPRWLIRLGLFLYDHLGGRKLLPGTRSVDLRHDAAGAPLKPGFTHAFEYSDCWVEDARLVALNARDAAERGAEILVRTRCSEARRAGHLWRIQLEGAGGKRREVAARALINATGPWVSSFLGGAVGMNAPDRIRTVKGSHIVVEKLFDHDRAYIFQNEDGRICFAIPYEHDFTLIGTTDADFNGEPGKVAISEAETDYLLAAANEYFQASVTRANIRWTYAGIRPLYDDGASKAQDATRDYVLKLEGGSGEAPLLSIFGGKITTYRRLAEAALDKLKPTFPAMAAPWTARAKLPGGDFEVNAFAAEVGNLSKRYPFLELKEARRLVRAYGTRAAQVLGDAKCVADLGRRFGPSLTAAEVDYLMREEWATQADDIIWRRSKLGLHMSPAEQAALQEYMSQLERTPAFAGSDHEIAPRRG